MKTKCTTTVGTVLLQIFAQLIVCEMKYLNISKLNLSGINRVKLEMDNFSIQEDFYGKWKQESSFSEFKKILIAVFRSLLLADFNKLR